MIDEIPVLAVAALFAEGQTVIQDAAELRVKESDRLAVMATQLNQMGGNVTERPDGLTIAGDRAGLVGTTVDSYTDHRVGMSLAIAALRASGTTILQRAEAAAISYPTFWDTLTKVCQA
jgi:3-phosphoshikimate 1-carboxyvinyltransferase